MALPETPATPAVEPEKPQTPAPEQTPKPEQVQEKPQEEPKYVTQEQLDSIKADIIRDVTMRDRQRASEIKKQVNQIEKTLEASGISVTAEQKEKIETQVAASYSDEEPAAPQEEIPAELEDSFAMMKKENVVIEEGDPEYTQFLKPLFDEDNSQRWEFTAAFRKAIDAKKARTLQQKDNAQLRAPVGGGEGPGELKAKSSRDYWDRAHTK